MSGRPLRVAVLGAGTVGREVIRGFLDHPERLRPVDGSGLALVGVAVRDEARAIASGIPAELVGDAPAHLVASPGTDVIVELLGGDEPARTLVAAALSAGKAVVTANKHLVARHGAELEEIARRTGATLRFEAAVGGGIPVLGPLASDLAANRVRSVRGIVNGTTNYILTAMVDDGRSYDDVLAAAQAAGYAEADPRADVEGGDAIDKLVILARLAFGTWLDPATIADRVQRTDGSPGAPGITGVTGADLAAAADAGWTIKLLASARRPDGRADPIVEATVVPTAVPAGSPLARTAGVLNRIEVEAEPVGIVAFAGPGAGGPATSSAVLGDLVAVARELGSTWAGLPAAGPGGSVAADPGDAPTMGTDRGAPAFAGPSGARYPIAS